MMKRAIALLLFFVAQSFGAMTLTLTGPASMAGGSTQTLTVTMSGGAAPKGIQFSLITPTGIASIVPSAGPVLTAKSLQCVPGSPLLSSTASVGGGLTCVISGSTSATISDGVIVSFAIVSKYLAPFPMVFSIPDQAAQSITGSALSVARLGSAPSPNLCDINQNGTVDQADLQLVTGAVAGLVWNSLTTSRVGLPPLTTFSAQTTWSGGGGLVFSCDINGDGVCDILDVLMVSNFLATGSCS